MCNCVGVVLTISKFLDVCSTSQKEQKSDEGDEKTEGDVASPTVDGNESNSDKCASEADKEESTVPSPEVVAESTEPSKANDSDEKPHTSRSDEPSKNSDSNSEDNLIDVEDSDDYLLYLETILKTIHSRFYSYYDTHQKVSGFDVRMTKNVN